MLQDVYRIRRALRTTALSSAVALLLAPAFAHAFDPNSGEDTSVTTRTSSRSKLPSTAPLLAPMPKLIFAPAPPNRVMPSENMNANAQQTTATTAAASEPTAGSMPSLAPMFAKTSAPAPAPQFPPVDPAVAAQAQQELAAHPSVIAPVPDFSAPAPLVASTTPVIPVKPVAVIAPSSSVAAVVEPVPTSVASAGGTSTLNPATKAILNKLPSKLSTAKPPASGKFAVNRMSPDVKPVGDKDDSVKSYDAVGLSIKVAKPGLDSNYELNRAYTALMGGDTTTAVETYKNILASDPENQDALFGLASTYHRQGQLDKARPYYGELLKVNPTHREGLNNFLALVSEESPTEALAELERLEQKNPDFSPIPAQESIVLNKLGYYDQAREKLLRAIELAPENLTYKYNLAVMFDHQGDYADASALYRLLIDASLKGEKLPASTETLQKRLNYITTAATATATVGG